MTRTCRVAVLADIHGNLLALEAVLEHLNRQAVDHVVVAGDIVNALPDSRACWDLVRSLGCTLLRGNHERYIFDYGSADADPAWATERFQPLRWTLAQFDQTDLAHMRALPLSCRLPGLLISHSSPHSDQGNVTPETPVETLEAMFEGTTEPLLVRAHNHRWTERNWNGRTLISVASVGLPLNGNRAAQYLILTYDGSWRWDKQFVPYDVAAALERFDTSGYRDAAGPLSRIFRRELATARNHLIPFLEGYLRALDRGELSLHAAVEAFLTPGSPQIQPGS